MADELFTDCNEQKIWPMCSLNIALMAGEVIGIILRYCISIFGQLNRTKNRGAYVDGVIWLVSSCDGPN
jgi:hypothetical protein